MKEQKNKENSAQFSLMIHEFVVTDLFIFYIVVTVCVEPDLICQWDPQYEENSQEAML